jgi:hypothetical protein
MLEKDQTLNIWKMTHQLTMLLYETNLNMYPFGGLLFETKCKYKICKA